MDGLDERVWAAQGDAWQAEGRLREHLGGGAVEFPGIRLMASGLPHPQWNNGDVTDPVTVPWAGVRAWYAARAGGAGVPWGVRAPAGRHPGLGRLLFRKRCMGLASERFATVDTRTTVEIRTAAPADAADVAAIDAAAFDEPIERIRRWVEPHLDAPGFTVALAELDGVAVGIATAIRTDDRAGPCVGIFGVAVLERARRRGVASALTSWLLGRALAGGATLAHLNPDSVAAERLYARLGFVETAGLDVYVDL